jgi:hypothetical protein
MSRTFLRKIALAAALFWLPMSVFAQLCATQSLVMKIGGHDHPALAVAQESERSILAAQTPIAVVDAATFWQSVDAYDEGCDKAALCALASIAAPIIASVDVSFEPSSSLAFHVAPTFSSRATTPDTPPPRRAR